MSTSSEREEGRQSVISEAGMVESIASGARIATTPCAGRGSSGGAGNSTRERFAQGALPLTSRRGRVAAVRETDARCPTPASTWTRALACVLLLAAGVFPVAGCGKFFQPTTTTTGTGTGGGTGAGSGTGTTTHLYVANANGTGTSNLAAFSLNSGTLTPLSGSPYNLGDTPLALALTPNNNLLYVAGVLNGLYVFPVNSDGSLGAGASAFVTSAQALAIDPTGQWLLAMGQQAGSVPTLSLFAINTTTGTLTLEQNATVALDGGAPARLLFVPGTTSTSLVYASLRTGGVDVLSFDSSSGTLSKLPLHLNPKSSNAYSDIGLSATPDGQYLYVGEIGTGGVRSFAIQSDGSLTELAASPTVAGPAVNAVTVDATGSYLYVSNTNTTIGNATPANVINAFAISSTDGILTPVTGSPFAACSAPIDFAEDSTKSYLAVACQGGSPDLQVFPLGATVAGGLGTAFGASTGTTTPAGAYAVVASH